MITKLHTPHSNLASTLRYNFRKVEAREAKVFYTRGLRYLNNDEVSFLETKERMLDWLPENYRTNNIVFHASINPHEKDNLDDATMEAFIDEYMESLGYGSQPYIVFKHHDIDREHYHVVSLNVDHNGKKINDKFIKRRSWNILQDLSAKYGILPPNLHLREERDRLLREAPEPIMYQEGDLAEKIKHAVEYALEVYKPKSIGELSAILLGYNIKLEGVKNKSDDEEDGLIYSIVDEKNNRVSTGIKAFDLGYLFLREQLEIRFRENKRIWKKEKANRIKFAIVWALRNAKDPISFVDNMEELGVNTLLRFNDQGRIYGVTFIDTKRGTVCNGSDIGKDFSANVLNDYFSRQIHHRWSINTERSNNIEKEISNTLSKDRSLTSFIKKMSEKGIEVMIEQDEDGKITNLIFADHRQYVVTNSNELPAHYSTALLQNYFQNGGKNFWKNDLQKNAERVLHAEENSYIDEELRKDNDDSLLHDIIDSIDTGNPNKALAVGRMYQRQAERNWGRRR